MTTPPTEAEWEARLAAFAAEAPATIAARAAVDAARQALTDVLALAGPAPYAVDAAWIDAAQAALNQYTALPAPPPDVVDLANKVTAVIQSARIESGKAIRAAYQAGDAAFLNDATVTLPQLIAHVRALTTQLQRVRDT